MPLQFSYDHIRERRNSFEIEQLEQRVYLSRSEIKRKRTLGKLSRSALRVDLVDLLQRLLQLGRLID